ncbi:MAG: EAL domain-containing protein [Angelakisella sp.]
MGINKLLRKTALISIVLPFILVVVGVLSFSCFQRQTLNLLKEHSFGILYDSARKQSAELRITLDGQFTVLETFAGGLATQKSYNYNNTIFRLNAVAEASEFIYTGVADLEGNCYFNDNSVVNIKDRTYYTEALSGVKNIQSVKESRLDGKHHLVMAVPIVYDHAVAGVVIGGFSEKTASNFVRSEAYGGQAYSFICDSNGDMIIRTEKPMVLESVDNIMKDALRKVTLLDGKQVKDIEQDFMNNRSGVVAYKYHDEKRYLAYEPLGINGWYILTGVDGKLVDFEYDKIHQIATTCIAIIIFCSFALFMVILYIEKTNLKNIKEQHAAYLKTYRTDSLTGLLNQQGFENKASEILSHANTDKYYAIVDFDINGFEKHNTLYGYESGNSLLIHIGNFITDNHACDEVYSRFLSDRFVCLLTGDDQNSILNRIQHINHCINDFLPHAHLLGSFGLYEVTDKTMPITYMCDCALIAKRTIKENYTQTVAIYDKQLHKNQIEDAELISSMEDGLNKGEFVPYYQPKYDAYSERIVGAEALVRWVRAPGEIMAPHRFVPLFEKVGLIRSIDFYMFEAICKKFAGMLQQNQPVVPISVNFSRVHLYNVNFPEQLLQIAKKYDVPTHYLDIEFTESVLLESLKILVQNIDRLHKFGFLVSLDDFGSGFSSLNMLKDADFDTIKLDRNFLCSAIEHTKGRTVIKNILTLAGQLNVKIVAEGVENAHQLAFLKENGCDITVQGYYFAKPMPEIDFDKLLSEKREALI